MRTGYIVTLIVLLTISAVALLSIYRPRVILNSQDGTFIQLIAEEKTPLPHKIHSLSISTNELRSSHHLYQKVNVINVWPISNPPPTSQGERRVQDQ